MTLMCHPEAELKDLAKQEEILRFAQNDTLGVNFGNSDLFRYSNLDIGIYASLAAWLNVIDFCCRLTKFIAERVGIDE